VEGFQPVAGGIDEGDERAHEALVGERGGFAPHRHAGPLQPCRQRIERRRVGHLPAKIALALGERAVHHQALLAVVHAERPHAPATVHRLHAEPFGGEIRPVIRLRAADAKVAERLDGHVRVLLFLTGDQALTDDICQCFRVARIHVFRDRGWVRQARP
jgi:hypothetical protein